MPKKKKGNLLGSWSFLIGVVLAVIFGVIQGGNLSPLLMYILMFLGIVVGLLNVSDEEVKPFLMAGAVLVIVSSLGQAVVRSAPIFENVLISLTVLFVPATIIVALKHVFTIARN